MDVTFTMIQPNWISGRNEPCVFRLLITVSTSLFSFTYRTNRYPTRNTCKISISIIRYTCKAQNEEFVKFLAVLWNSINNLDVTLCSCMSKWADVPEVALVSVAKSDEPFSAWILCNNRGWAVSGKEIKHRVIDFKCSPLCCNQQSESRRKAHWPHSAVKYPQKITLFNLK